MRCLHPSDPLCHPAPSSPNIEAAPKHRMRPKSVRFRVVIQLATVCSMAAGLAMTQPAQAERDPAAIARIFESGTPVEKILAAKDLEFSGITDKALFDLINALLLASYSDVGDDRAKITQAASLCRALVTSGRPEYKKTFEQIAASETHPRLRKQARESLERIDEFSAWNKVMNSTEFAEEGRSDRDARLLAMLRSDDPTMKRQAAYDIVRDGVDDATLYEVIEKELLAGYQQNTNERKQVDAIAWLCKALGRSGDPRYKGTLKKVMETARSRHVAKHARIVYTALN